MRRPCSHTSPATSRLLGVIIDGPTIPHLSQRALLRDIEAQFADIIDDHIGAGVGARCWAAADPYLKVLRIFLAVLEYRSWKQKIDC